MRTTVIAALIVLALAPATLLAKPHGPSVPDTGASGTLEGQVLGATTTPAAFPAAADRPRTHADLTPLRVNIPVIGLDDPIEQMGVLSNGELAVPSGATDHVGWWMGGSAPGEMGSAVFDAHVFAAFSNLYRVKSGDDIYVEQADGGVAHFVVKKVEVFNLGDLSADYLFNRADARRLTLITCAGQLTPDHSTYTQRLVVSAVLAE